MFSRCVCVGVCVCVCVVWPTRPLQDGFLYGDTMLVLMRRGSSYSILNSVHVSVQDPIYKGHYLASVQAIVGGRLPAFTCPS